LYEKRETPDWLLTTQISTGDIMGSGNGSDNAHNNQFGGGSRGPTGGVNTGSSSSGNGGSGNGFYQYRMDEPYKPEYNSKGELVVTISKGPTWVSDDSIHWSDGRNGGNSRDSTRTNTTAKVNNGYRAAIDGYIYMVTVNGGNDITAVNLYSRPITSTRKDWSKNESLRIVKAKALVQAQLDLLKANAASEAKKTADAKAAAEAKRKADEEALRKQAEWDAAHPVEAATRTVNDANSILAQAEQAKNVAQNNFNAANDVVNQRQAEYNQALQNEAVRKQEFDKVNNSNYYNAPPTSGPGRLFRDMSAAYQGAKQNSANKKSALDNAVSQRVSPQNGLNNANATYNSALQATNNAKSALVKAQQDAKAKQEAEARRQAEAAAKLKAANEAEAKRQADEQAKNKAAADAVTKAAALEAVMSMLEQPNVFAVRGLAASNAVSIAPMSFAETGLGSLTFTTEGASLSWMAVRSAISKLLTGAVINTGMGAVLASIAYVPQAGAGSDKVPGRNNINMFSTVMDPAAINLSDESKIKQALKNGGEISSELSARVYFDDNEFRTELIRTPKPTMIKVVQAVKDTVTGLYGYTIPSDGGLPSRTILISPSDVPGVGGLPPLVNPIETKIGFTNTGNQNQPPESFSIETYPLEDEPDFSHLILVFEGLNLKPLYVVFQDSLDDGKYTRKQLDKKFKHASDFGVNDLKKNKETLTKFRDALDTHLSDVNTVEKGTYILSKDSKVFYNPKTKNVVVLRDDGMFVSGWKLIPNTAQYINYIENGVLR
jgi:hypothetical protein